MAYIQSILQKIDELNISNSQVGKKVGLDPQIITDMRNGKRKQLYVEHVVAFSKALNYNFFDEIQENSLITAPAPKKKVKVTVQIEVDETSKEREILESIMDAKTVKKLIG